MWPAAGQSLCICKKNLNIGKECEIKVPEGLLLLLLLLRFCLFVISICLLERFQFFLLIYLIEHFPVVCSQWLGHDQYVDRVEGPSERLRHGGGVGGRAGRHRLRQVRGFKTHITLHTELKPKHWFFGSRTGSRIIRSVSRSDLMQWLHFFSLSPGCLVLVREGQWCK